MEPHPACCLGPQQPPGPAAACRLPACHFLLLLSELTGRQKERGSLNVRFSLTGTFQTITVLTIQDCNRRSFINIDRIDIDIDRILTKREVLWENEDYPTDWLSRGESMNLFLKDKKQLGRVSTKTEDSKH